MENKAFIITVIVREGEGRGLGGGGGWEVNYLRFKVITHFPKVGGQLEGIYVQFTSSRQNSQKEY